MSILSRFTRKKPIQKAKFLLAAFIAIQSFHGAQAGQARFENHYEQSIRDVQQLDDEQVIRQERQLEEKFIKRDMTTERAQEIIGASHSSVRGPFMESFSELGDADTNAAAHMKILNLAKHVEGRNHTYERKYRELIHEARRIQNAQPAGGDAGTYPGSSQEANAALELRNIHNNKMILLAWYYIIQHQYPKETRLLNELGKYALHASRTEEKLLAL